MQRARSLTPIARRTIVAVVAAFFLTPALGGLAAPTGKAPASDAALARAIDAYVRPLVERGDLSGQLLVTRGDRTVLERSYGYVNRELGIRVTPESRFCIASVTKPMTVLIAFRLIEQKKIAYRDSIARWLPDFPKADSITIEHLLRHRSGIPHEIVPDSLATVPRTAAEMVDLAKHRPLDFPPGSQSSYSSGGFTVLTRILEIASGRSYQSLLDEHLFAPLGMTHSRDANSAELLPNRASPYKRGVRGIENAPFQDFSGIVGAGSVWSTARDLHRFVQAIVTGKLGETSRRSWVRGGKLNFNGRTGGFRAFADWDSASGLEMIFTGNLLTGAPDVLRAAIQKLATGGTPEPFALPALSDAPADPIMLRGYEGVFRLENGVRLTVTVRDGALWSNGWQLVPARDGTFFSPSDYGIVRGVPGPDGRIARLDWTQAGVTYAAPRVE